MRILVLNGGSSNFKCWLGEISGEPIPAAAPKPIWEAHVDRDGSASIGELLGPVLHAAPGPVDVVGHRIVYGGEYRESTPLTAKVKIAIAAQSEIAPAHNRAELAAVEAVEKTLGSVRQIAVFDSGFHSTIEPPAYVYPGPYEWLAAGIRRVGFHGISYRYASRLAVETLGLGNSHRLIICHLGNGASVAGVRDGRSVDTTMGFTPLEGLMMGTRCGSVDPGIIVYLLRHRGYTAERLDEILNRESGLLGISGISGDMREIQAAMEKGHERARLAFDIYAHRLCREVGAMLGVLGGADAIVFTGGIGEHCAPLREIVAKRFGFLPHLKMLVVHAEEEWEIARDCFQLSRRLSASPA